MKIRCKNGHERIPENLQGTNCKICAKEIGYDGFGIARTTSIASLPVRE